MTPIWLRLTLVEMRDKYTADAVTLARLFPNSNFETQSDCAIEARRNLETAIHEINGLLAMSDVSLIELTRKDKS